SELGADLEELESLEHDAALGNGGLGRLAACFLDSLATLDYPGFGYGINYEFGLFRQTFVNGFQHEKPDHWLEGGSPWLIERPDDVIAVPVYGSVAHNTLKGTYKPAWIDAKVLLGVPNDMPNVGAGGDIVKRYRETHDYFDDIPEKVAIQMNDTHPALTIAELMRMFIDEYHLAWEHAWAITVDTCGYTNHTLLPEASERWPTALLERVL